jgi:glycosyltransferase involved in cell wall biosynthesis
MPVLAPNYGAVLDYLTEQNATLIAGRLERRFFAMKNDHSGSRFRCDVGDIIDKLKTILLDLDKRKRCAQIEGLKIRREYTWDKVADLIVAYTC